MPISAAPVAADSAAAAPPPGVGLRLARLASQPPSGWSRVVTPVAYSTGCHSHLLAAAASAGRGGAASGNALAPGVERLAGELAACAVLAPHHAPRVADQGEAEHPAERDEHGRDSDSDVERLHRSGLHGERDILADLAGIYPGERLSARLRDGRPRGRREAAPGQAGVQRSEEHTSELQSPVH